ncbi:MAG: VOC family protein [Sphingomicrobium sp.]
MSSPSPAAAHIDHIILGTADLDSGIAQLQRLTGVRVAVGGVHPGRGTRNALMSLGGDIYVELLAPDPAQSVDTAEVRDLLGYNSLTPVGWAVTGTSETKLRAALTGAGFAITPSEPGSRRRPDGSILRWVTFGYATIDDPLAPFFILWADPAFHPSRTSPSGCRLLEVHLDAPSESRISAAIAPLGMGVDIENSRHPRMRLKLDCPKGHVSL